MVNTVVIFHLPDRRGVDTVFVRLDLRNDREKRL
jgi:hypothetical protein